MSDSGNTPPADPQQQGQREQVKRNMENATEDQPSEFRDAANEAKRVEIPPVTEKNPIQGLDP